MKSNHVALSPRPLSISKTSCESIPPSTIPHVEWIGCNSLHFFWGATMQCLMVVHVLQFPYMFQNSCFRFPLFKGIYSKTWKVVFYCNFGSPSVNDWEMFMCLLTIYCLHTFFGNYSSLSLFLSWDVWIFVFAFVFLLALAFLTHSEY